MKLAASAEAKPFSGPIQLVATDLKSGKQQKALAELTSSTSNNGVPGGFSKLVVNSTEQLWLTVLPPATKDAKAK